MRWSSMLLMTLHCVAFGLQRPIPFGACGADNRLSAENFFH